MTGAKKVILVTGGGGYLGSVMVPILLEMGYAVKVIDRFFWGKEVLAPGTANSNLTLIGDDVRTYPKRHLQGVDVVIDLAALSNDPIAELDPRRTFEINCDARIRTASLAKDAGVQRYVMASSCSVYGFQDGILNETSRPSPVTTYARAALVAEEGVLPFSSKAFSVTALRQGTLYGLSPRMRFDLVLNTMVLSFFREKLITVQGGEQWRPLVHVADSAAAFICIAEAALENVSGQIFNVGSSEQNFQIKDLAKRIASVLDESSRVVVQEVQTDFRSYRVAFEKITKATQWRAKKTPEDGAREVYAALKSGRISATPQTKTIDWYRHLLSQDPGLLDAPKQ